jgi:hypothetical protein
VLKLILQTPEESSSQPEPEPVLQIGDKAHVASARAISILTAQLKSKRRKDQAVSSLSNVGAESARLSADPTASSAPASVAGMVVEAATKTAAEVAKLKHVEVVKAGGGDGAPAA